MLVRVVRQSGESALVEYVDHAGPHRVTVPVLEICDNGVADSELALGIEYGEAWEDLLRSRVTPEAIAAALRVRNIWTYEDMMSAPSEVKGAIASVVSEQFAQLINAARATHENREV